MTTPRLLVVDDNAANRDLLARRLEKRGYRVSACGSGAEALEAIARGGIDLVLLDLEMPGLSGHDVLGRIRERFSASDLPVIIVSAHHETEAIVTALAHGANDYLTKPMEFAIALARIEAQIVRRRVDLARQRTDVLTGLPNRVALADAWDGRPADSVLLCVNVDRFRTLNGALGWVHGDRLLKDVAARLAPLAGPSGLAVRLAGDEFGLLIGGVDPRQAAARVAAALLEPFPIGEQQVFITVSVGAACAQAGVKLDESLASADAALHRAKARGGDRCEVFEPGFQSRAAARLQIETELAGALAHQRLDIRYQPILRLADETLVGFEALVRLPRAHARELFPTEFIPVAEESGLILALGRFILDRVCTDLQRWQDRSLVPAGFSVAVNTSGRQLRDAAFGDFIEELLARTGLAPRLLSLEITESVLMESSDDVRHLLRRLASLGLGLSLDDFGTGYSSLSCLEQFAVHRLKIDRVFVGGIERSETKRTIVSTIVRLANALGMTTVAEGIETREELELMKALGCEFGQGYLYAHPLTCADATAALAWAGAGQLTWPLQVQAL